MIKRLALASTLAFATAHAATPLGSDTTAAARYARQTYGEKVIESLASMVSFNTVADAKVPFEKNPQHIGFKRFIKQEASHLGLDFADHGYIMVIGLGEGKERVGVITHGDVQPVDPSKWKQSPFKLDRTSEPGLIWDEPWRQDFPVPIAPSGWKVEFNRCNEAPHLQTRSLDSPVPAAGRDHQHRGGVGFGAMDRSDETRREHRIVDAQRHRLGRTRAR